MRFQFQATKRKGQEIRCPLDYINFTGKSTQYKTYRPPKTLLILCQCLSAYAAGTDGMITMIRFVDICQSQFCYCDTGIHRRRCRQRHALRADSRRKTRILLVRPCYDLPILQPYGHSHPEFRIRRICVAGCFTGSVEQPGIPGFQCMDVRKYFYRNMYTGLLHPEK